MSVLILCVINKTSGKETKNAIAIEFHFFLPSTDNTYEILQFI